MVGYEIGNGKNRQCRQESNQFRGFGYVHLFFEEHFLFYLSLGPLHRITVDRRVLWSVALSTPLFLTRRPATCQYVTSFMIINQSRPHRFLNDQISAKYMREPTNTPDEINAIDLVVPEMNRLWPVSVVPSW